MWPPRPPPPKPEMTQFASITKELYTVNVIPLPPWPPPPKPKNIQTNYILFKNNFIIAVFVITSTMSATPSSSSSTLNELWLDDENENNNQKTLDSPHFVFLLWKFSTLAVLKKLFLLRWLFNNNWSWFDIQGKQPNNIPLTSEAHRRRTVTVQLDHLATLLIYSWGFYWIIFNFQEATSGFGGSFYRFIAYNH